jgi:hypothetical protein
MILFHLLLHIFVFQQVVIINLLIDDMEIALDFFDYFEAAAKLLDNDKYVTLLCFLIANLRNSIYKFLYSLSFYSNHCGTEGRLWLFLLGTTMVKSSLFTTQVCTMILLLSNSFPYLEGILFTLLC